MSIASSVAEEPKMAVGGRFYLSYVLFSLLIFPVHELGHYSAYRIMGVQLQMTLNTSSPRDPSLRKPIAEFAGPLVNLIIVLVAAATFHATGRKWRWLATLALAAAMMRLVIYTLIVSAALVTGSGLTLGNDEPISAHLWGLPSLTLVAVLAVPFGAAVWSNRQNLPRKCRSEGFACGRFCFDYFRCWHVHREFSRSPALSQ